MGKQIRKAITGSVDPLVTKKGVNLYWLIFHPSGSGNGFYDPSGRHNSR